MLGMNSKPVQYFFNNWNYPEEEKKRFYDWVNVVVENGDITESHYSGFTISNATIFVWTCLKTNKQTEGGIRTCIVPLLNMRMDVNVDFSELPNADGSFKITLSISNKASPLDDLLSGF